MKKFLKIATTSEVPPGSSLLFEVANQYLALFNVNGEYFCIADVCSHDDGPLAEGAINNCEIECPRHGARFDLRTGAALCMPAVRAIPVYPVQVIDGDIHLEWYD